MPGIHLSFLGPVHVLLEDRPADFATDKALALLIYLAVESRRTHRRQTLAGLLWPDQPQDKASQSLRQAFSITRRALGAISDKQPGITSCLKIDRQSAQFDSRCDHWLDVAQFNALWDACQVHGHRNIGSCLPCIQRLQHMAALYAGDFLEHFFLSDSEPFEEWVIITRESLRRKMVAGLIHLSAFHMRRGEYHIAREYIQKQITLEPWREEAHQQLMYLLAMEGQRSAALAQYEQCRQVLSAELGVQPGEKTLLLFEAVRDGNWEVWRGRPAASATSVSPSSVPHLDSPLFGREKELAHIAEYLSSPDCRLLTLVGAGGIGKTRLALEAAQQHVGLFPNGVFFIPLSAVGSRDQIVPAIAEGVGFTFSGSDDPLEQLKSLFHRQDLLLILDNFEHLLEEAGVLSSLLTAAPGLKILVTSRERLNLRPEFVYAMEGLGYPDGVASEGEDFSHYGAVALFLDRARQVRRDFGSRPGDTSGALRICHLVEGLPLGIELAAAGAWAQSAGEIARQLEASLDTLVSSFPDMPPRHSSIRAAMNHSWNMLSSHQQEVLCRLSVFRGGFDPVAAEVVAQSTVQDLEDLHRKSLLRQDDTGRYHMHGLIRQFAGEKLGQDIRQAEKSQRRHAEYYADLLAAQAIPLTTSEQSAALAVIARELDNARCAWTWACQEAQASILEAMLPGLHVFFDQQSRFKEGIQLLGVALVEPAAHLIPERSRAKIEARIGAMQSRLGNLSHAEALLQRSLTVFHREHLPEDEIFTLISLASVANGRTEWTTMRRVASRCLSLAQTTEHLWGIVSALYYVGMASFREGELQLAEDHFQKSLELGKGLGNQQRICSILNALGDLACHQGDYEKARRLFEESLTISQRRGNRYQIALQLNNMGTVLHVQGKLSEARSFYQQSLNICHDIGDLRGQAIALSNLGEVAYSLGELQPAYGYYQEALSIAREQGDRWAILAALVNLGELSSRTGDFEAARASLFEAVEMALQSQTISMLMRALLNLAGYYASHGRRQFAADILKVVQEDQNSELDIQTKAGSQAAKLKLPQPSSPPLTLEDILTSLMDDSPAS